MTSIWPSVCLGDVVTHRKEFITIDDLSIYRRPRVQLHAQGILLRDEVPGALIKTKKQQVVRAGEFLVAEIDAKVGGFGIVPPSLDGAIVSSHYFIFQNRLDRLDGRFLGWFIKTPLFRMQVEAQGSTNYAAIRPADVLRYKIPLPSLDEQHRIVSIIEKMTPKLAEALKLRNEAESAATQLVASAEMYRWPKEALANAPPLESLTTYLARGRQSAQGDSQHYLIKTQHVQQDRYVPTNLKLVDFAANKVSADAIVRHGDILIACSAAGCLGRVARYTDSSKTASTDTHVAIARPNPDLVDPDYLYAYLRGAQGQVQLRSRERGDWQREKISFRLTELNVADLRKVPVPLPSRFEQQQIVSEIESLRGQIGQVNRVQRQAATELNAMLPAILDKAFRGELSGRAGRP